MHAQGRGNASGRPEVLYALQGMLAHKAFDALQKNIERLNTYAAQGEYSSGWGAVSLSILIIINDTLFQLAGLATEVLGIINTTCVLMQIQSMIQVHHTADFRDVESVHSWCYGARP